MPTNASAASISPLNPPRCRFSRSPPHSSWRTRITSALFLFISDYLFFSSCLLLLVAIFSTKSFFDNVVVVVVIALASHCWWVFERHLNVFTKRVWQTRAKQIKPSTCRHRRLYRIKVNVFCARCHKRMSFLVIVVVAVVLSFRRRWADCITTYCGGHNEPQYSIVFQITKSRLRWSECGCGCGSPSSDAWISTHTPPPPVSTEQVG